MSADSPSTCWTVVRGAAAGCASDRETFARTYGPIIRAYLAARWRGSAFAQDLDDAQQEAFAECFKPAGVLERADPTQPGGFRAFLYGTVRNVALRFESRRGACRERPAGDSFLSEQADRDATLSTVFDRAWAHSIMRQAAACQSERAVATGEEAVRRVELLRLRFSEGLPIRNIARRWEADPVLVHRQYAKAREEFREALLSVMAYHHPHAAGEAQAECERLLAMLA